MRKVSLCYTPLLATSREDWYNDGEKEKDKTGARFGDEGEGGYRSIPVIGDRQKDIGPGPSITHPAHTKLPGGADYVYYGEKDASSSEEEHSEEDDSPTGSSPATGGREKGAGGPTATDLAEQAIDGALTLHKPGGLLFSSHEVMAPQAKEQILSTEPVPFRLRSMADREITHRIRMTTFLGRSRKKLRPEDLLLNYQDVSGIHCSVTCLGNAVLGYELFVAVMEQAKAGVHINGKMLEVRGKPYKLRVGDILGVGLRELWKLEHSTLEATPLKHVIDELELYEHHKEFVQLAISDIEVYQNVGAVIFRKWRWSFLGLGWLM